MDEGYIMAHYMLVHMDLAWMQHGPQCGIHGSQVTLMAQQSGTWLTLSSMVQLASAHVALIIIQSCLGAQ